LTGTIAGDLTVPASTCVNLQDAVVRGNVLIQPGAVLRALSNVIIRGDVNIRQEGSLHLFSGVAVGGSVTGADVRLIHLAGPNVRVGGSLTVNGGGVIIDIQQARIGGNVTIKRVFGGARSFMLLTSNTIGGDTIVNDNRTGDNVIAGNSIGGRLTCRETFPSPLDIGGPNTAKGGKFGQCAGL
jgi:hypothetical protein